MQSTLLHNVDKSELKQLIYDEVSSVMEKILSDYRQMQPPVQSVSDRLLTKKEAAAYLKISLPTLTRYVKLGYVKAVTIAGTRSRFRSSDLDKCLKGLRSR